VEENDDNNQVITFQDIDQISIKHLHRSCNPIPIVIIIRYKAEKTHQGQIMMGIVDDLEL